MNHWHTLGHSYVAWNLSQQFESKCRALLNKGIAPKDTTSPHHMSCHTERRRERRKIRTIQYILSPFIVSKCQSNHDKRTKQRDDPSGRTNFWRVHDVCCRSLLVVVDECRHSKIPMNKSKCKIFPNDERSSGICACMHTDVKCSTFLVSRATNHLCSTKDEMRLTAATAASF